MRGRKIHDGSDQSNVTTVFQTLSDRAYPIMKPFNLLSICQCLAFPTYTLVLITCTSILTATPLASTALLQHTRQCPCDFIVRTHAESGPFNFVLSPVRHESAQFSETLLALSRFNQTKRTAYRTTSEHAYHRLWVPVYGNVRLTVHTLGLVSDTLRNFSERAYIFPDDRQSDTCDVLIRQDPPDRSRNTTARIVGGLPANSKLAKSLAFLEIEVRKDGQSQLAICTATIIGPRTLITAAHCKGSGRAEAIIGERQISGNERSYEVESFTTHPRYAGSDVPEIVQFDIAIINLAQNITGDFKIMKYNKNDSLPKADGLVRSVGYGVTYEEKQDYGQLLQVDLIAQSDDECETRHRRVDIDLNSDRILCAGRTDRDGCGIWYVLQYLANTPTILYFRYNIFSCFHCSVLPRRNTFFLTYFCFLFIVFCFIIQHLFACVLLFVPY